LAKLRMLIASALLLSSCAGAYGQDWPARPVTMVVPFAPGGPVDTLGRMIAPYLGEVLGRQVVVENATGAGGMSGSLRVAQSAPDGYMFLLGSMGTHAINQTLYKKPLYNAATDFAPVALIADAAQVLITRRDFPATNLAEFIAHTKANHDKLRFSSGGTGTSTHIGCVLLNQIMGVDITHIPYRGGGPAMVDLTAGRIDYMCNIASTAVPVIENRSVNAIATLSRERTSALPHLPTAHEQGLKDFDAYTWNAVFFPKDTPAGIVTRLNEALGAVMDMPAFRNRLRGIGLIVVSPERRSPAHLREFVVSEIAKWAGPIRASGTSADQ
jgi:tripartite-type tricarboxylate transporter receptor subunit TctC